MEFEPRGKNLQVSLIMVESGKGENKERYIESRIDALIDELNIQVDETDNWVSYKSAASAWNFKG